MGLWSDPQSQRDSWGQQTDVAVECFWEAVGRRSKLATAKKAPKILLLALSRLRARGGAFEGQWSLPTSKTEGGLRRTRSWAA